MNQPKRKYADTIRDVMAANIPAPVNPKVTLSAEERLALASKSIANKAEARAAELGDGPASEAVDTIVLLDLNLIDDSPDQNRLTYPVQEIDALAMTLKTRQIEPIQVRRKADGRFELISGHRRVRAARSLSWSQIRAIIRDIDELEASLELMIANDSHESVGDYERAYGYRIAIKKHGLSQSEIANRLSVNRSIISARLKFFELPAEVLEAIDQHPRVMSYKGAIKLLEVLKEAPELASLAADGIRKMEASNWNINVLLSVLSSARKNKDASHHPTDRDEALITDDLSKPICSIRVKKNRPQFLELHLNKDIDREKFLRFITDLMNEKVKPAAHEMRIDLND